MDPGLAEQSSPEAKQTDPAFVNPSDNIPKPNLEGDTSCSDSDSDSSDGDDFFQLDPVGLGHPFEPVHSPRMPAEANIDPLHEEISLSAKYSSRSQIEDQAHAQSSVVRPTQATPPLPPTTPVRNDVPDPNRIPSSVFARTKSTSPMEWSVASNESLFSIHMGNSSFSRDNVFLMGRSGELGNFSGTGMDSYPTPPLSPTRSLLPSAATNMSPLPPLSPAPPACALPQPTPLVSSTPSGSNMGHGLDKPGAAEATNANAMNDVLRATVEKQESDKDKSGSVDAGHFSKSISHQSDGSTASFRSFAFPILTGDRGRSGSINTEPEHQRMQSQNAEQQTPKIADKEKVPAAAAATDAAPAAVAAPAPVPAPAPAPAEEDKGRLSCFSCCSFCC